MLLYVHGFNSSALSFKAALLRRRMSELRRSQDFACPELSHQPREAIAQLEQWVEKQRSESLALIGSSLGGYYATWLAERYAVPAVLVNPAVRPYTLLAGYTGRQKNLYTGEEYDFTDRHVDELRELEVDSITPQRYFLMVQTADDVLDYRDAIGKYAGCEQLVIEGGDHGFSDFERYLERVLAFCGVLAK
jgi:hypothetical protein